MRLGAIAGNIGIGLAAGFVGTLAITASQMIEKRIRKRQQSKTPAKAVENVFDIRPESEEAEERLNMLTHFGYGTAWGAFRGLLDSASLRGAQATAVHWAAVQGAAMVLLPSVKVAPPPTQWGAKEIAIEGLHHAVYAAAAGFTYDALSRNLYRPERPEGRLPWNLIMGALAPAALRWIQERDLGHRVAERAETLRENAARAGRKAVEIVF